MEETYVSVEAPKGELGIFLMSIIQTSLIDVELKHQGFYILQGLNFMTKNAYLADLVTIIGTQDLVFVKLIDKVYSITERGN
jgi:NADH dehydrogenase (ubiquinone) Fe-S protein 2